MGRNAKLSKEFIVAKSLQLIDRDGVEKFSLNSLAKYLDVKTSSLYNHISNLNELNILISSQVHQELTECISKKIKNKDGRELLLSFSMGYIKYAMKNPERYKMGHCFPKEFTGDVSLPFLNQRKLFLEIIRAVFELDDKTNALVMRNFRCFLHGLSMFQVGGGFVPIGKMEDLLKNQIDIFTFGVKGVSDGSN